MKCVELNQMIFLRQICAGEIVCIDGYGNTKANCQTCFGPRYVQTYQFSAVFVTLV